MGNWLDELDRDTKEYDRKLREDADKYDDEVDRWWRLDAEKEEKIEEGDE